MGIPVPTVRLAEQSRGRTVRPAGGDVPSVRFELKSRVAVTSANAVNRLINSGFDVSAEQSR